MPGASQMRVVHVDHLVVFGIVDVLVSVRLSFADKLPVLYGDEARERDRTPFAAGKRLSGERDGVFVLQEMKRPAEVRVRVHHLSVEDQQIEFVPLRKRGDCRGEDIEALLYVERTPQPDLPAVYPRYEVQEDALLGKVVYVFRRRGI